MPPLIRERLKLGPAYDLTLIDRMTLKLATVMAERIPDLKSSHAKPASGRGCREISSTAAKPNSAACWRSATGRRRRRLNGPGRDEIWLGPLSSHARTKAPRGGPRYFAWSCFRDFLSGPVWRADVSRAQRGSRSIYSMTSSAVESSSGEISIPSALAALRLIANSNFVGCSTGRSAGFSPLRIRPAYMPIWRYTELSLDP